MFKAQVDIVSYIYRNNYNMCSPLSSTNLRTTPKCITQLRHRRDLKGALSRPSGAMEWHVWNLRNYCDTSLRLVAPSLLSGGGCGYTQARMTQSQLRVQQYVSQASNVTNHKNQLCKTARLTRLSFQKPPLRSFSLLFESICASFLYLILYLFFILIFRSYFYVSVNLVAASRLLLFMHQFKKPTAVNVLL